MRTCDRCEQQLSETTERDGKVCDKCALNWFKAQVAHSEQYEREMEVKLRPGWQVKVFNTSDIDGDDMMHIDVRMRNEKLGISISIAKTEWASEENSGFVIWVGDKKLIVLAEPVNEDNSDGSLGVVLGVLESGAITNLDERGV